MAFCSNCGSQIPDGAPACPVCGQPSVFAPARPKSNFKFSDKLLANFTKILTFVMIGLAGTAILYGLIDGIVQGTKGALFGGFGNFARTFAQGIFHSAIYTFFAVVSAYLNKKFTK